MRWWVREAAGEPSSKKPRTKDEVQRKDTIYPLRFALVGNENRRDIPKVFFDADDEAPFERAVRAMDLAREAGAAHIAVATERLR